MLHDFARRGRLGTAAVAVAVMCLGAAACGSSGGGKTSGTTTSSSKKITIAFATYSEDVVFDVALVNGIKAEGKALGINVIIDNANGDANTQATQVQQLILQHVSGVLITPVDSAAIDPSIIALNKAKIPVVAVSAAPTGGTIWTTITANTVEIGHNQAIAAVNLLKQRYGSAKGNVVFGEGTPTVNVAVNELNGFKSALAAYPNVHLLATFVGNYTESDSYTNFLPVLAAHPQTSGPDAIDVAVGADDNTAAGISQAITHLGRNLPVASKNRILIIGADGSPLAVQMLESKQWSADIGLDPVNGGMLAVKELYKAIKGASSPGPNFYEPQPVLTPANVASSGIWGLTYK
jgi:ribose transport system substrate-binding protein